MLFCLKEWYRGNFELFFFVLIGHSVLTFNKKKVFSTTKSENGPKKSFKISLSLSFINHGKSA